MNAAQRDRAEPAGSIGAHESYRWLSYHARMEGFAQPADAKV